MDWLAYSLFFLFANFSFPGKEKSKPSNFPMPHASTSSVWTLGDPDALFGDLGFHGYLQPRGLSWEFLKCGFLFGCPLKKHKHGMGDMQRGYYLENYPHSLNAGYMDLGWGCWAVTFEIWCSGLWGGLYFGLEMRRLEF